MAGPCPGKTRIPNVDVFIHEPNDNDGTTNVHIDLEHPLLAEIIETDESTFVGGKPAGAFIGLRTKQADRASEIADELSLPDEAWDEAMRQLEADADC